MFPLFNEQIIYKTMRYEILDHINACIKKFDLNPIQSAYLKSPTVLFYINNGESVDKFINNVACLYHRTDKDFSDLAIALIKLGIAPDLMLPVIDKQKISRRDFNQEIVHFIRQQLPEYRIEAFKQIAGFDPVFSSTETLAVSLGIPPTVILENRDQLLGLPFFEEEHIAFIGEQLPEHRIETFKKIVCLALREMLVIKRLQIKPDLILARMANGYHLKVDQFNVIMNIPPETLTRIAGEELYNLVITKSSDRELEEVSKRLGGNWKPCPLHPWEWAPS